MFYFIFFHIYIYEHSLVTYNCTVHGADLTYISLLVILCMWWIKKSWILRTRQCVTSLPCGQLVLTSWPPSSQRSSTDHWSCAKSPHASNAIHLNTFKKNSNIKNFWGFTMLMTVETCHQSCEKGPVKEPVVFFNKKFVQLRGRVVNNDLIGLFRQALAKKALAN